MPRFVELMVRHTTISVCSVLTQPMLEWNTMVPVERVTPQNSSMTGVPELGGVECVLTLLAVRR